MRAMSLTPGTKLGPYEIASGVISTSNLVCTPDGKPRGTLKNCPLDSELSEEL